MSFINQNSQQGLQQSRSKRLRELLTKRETFATSLLAILIDLYGSEALSWTPQAIALELHDDFQVDIPQATIDKIMAAISILTSDDFYRRVSVFNNICNVLSGDTFDPTIFEPASVDEIAWGITEAVLLSPPEEGDQFSSEITGFIAKMLEAEGITKIPAVLRFAAPATQNQRSTCFSWRCHALITP
jgi:hypothetical protein